MWPVTTALQTQATGEDAALLERILADGDIARLTPAQRVAYYRMRCEAAGLDHRAQPFMFVSLQGKLVLYATKSATQQLAAKHRISTQIVSRGTEDGLHVVVVRASKPDGGATDEIGAVSVQGLKGEQLANAYMKAATKAKRRAVLALCGLGEMDETEVDSVPKSARVDVDLDTGEVIDAAQKPAPSGKAAAPKGGPAQVHKPAPKPANPQQAAAAPLVAVRKRLAELREIAPADWRARIDSDVAGCGQDVTMLEGLAGSIAQGINELDAKESGQ